MRVEMQAKQAIAQAFGRAAQHYDQYAELQRTCGEHLLSLLATQEGAHVLDAGCGTGYFSRRWRRLGKRVTALDLSVQMLQQAAAADSADAYLQGDIEHLPLRNGCVDICFSNLAVQWCDDLAQALAACYRVITPGGVVAFTTLADGSLSELAQAWREVDGSHRVNRFLSMAQIAQCCYPYRHQLQQHTLTYNFPDVMAVMQSLKGIGATGLYQDRTRALMTRQRLQRLTDLYPRTLSQPGFPLSYQVVYGVIYRD